jgi:hypothetical protein
MRVFAFVLVTFSLMVANKAIADSVTKSGNLGNGWISLTKQSDPFDSSKVKAFQIMKNSFTFRCGELNMEVNSYGFESLSFGADLKYVIDEQEPVDKQGRYSTYLGGSNMVTDSRYFSFRLNDEDIDAMKAGYTLKVAGKYSTTGWHTKTLNLVGFTAAYNQMCQ